MGTREQKEEFKKRIMKYVVRLIRFLKCIPADPVTDEIKKQVVRSGSSVGANYFESVSASSKKDFMLFFRHSLKSANETSYWLRLLAESDCLSKDLESEYAWLAHETDELSKILTSSILTMKQKP